MKRFSALVMGTSAGGLHALSQIFPALPKDFPIPIIVVQHLSPDSDNLSTGQLDRITDLIVKEADHKEIPVPGVIYLAAPNYHLLIERDLSLALSVDGKVNYSRPSIDVLFETAADGFMEGLISVILTGANKDGTEGCRKVKERGGVVVAQDPLTAEVPVMPQEVIDSVGAHYVVPIDKMGLFLNKLAREEMDE